MQSYLNNKGKISILLFCSILLLPYFLLCFYIFPAGDDFSYASIGKSNFPLDLILNERYRWNGRYLSNFIVILNPIRYNHFGLYQLNIALLLLIYLFSIYKLTSLFFKQITAIICISIIIALSSFSLLPSLSEGIYWYTSALTYFLSAILFFTQIYLIVKLEFYNGKYSKLVCNILVIFLILINSGLNETIILINLLLLIGILYIKKQKILISNLNSITNIHIFIVIQLLLLTYVYTAPGNELRASYFNDNHQILRSFFYTFLYTIRFLGSWLFSPIIIFGSLLLVNLPINIKAYSGIRILLFTILFLIAPTLIACFTPIWSTGLLGQYRTPNLSLFLFIPTYFFLLLQIKNLLIAKLIFARNRWQLWSIAFGISLVFWGNSFSVYKDLITGEAKSFHLEQNKRLSLIKECKKNKEKKCLIPKLKNKPSSIFVYDITSDPNHFLNHCYNQYFEVDTKVIPLD